MSINVNSEAYCRKAYLNYHCYGNTMNLSAEDMGKITQAWGNKLSSWQATVTNDENEYDFDDSDYSDYKKQGKEAATEATGYKKALGDDKTAVAGHAAGAAAGAILSNSAGKVFANQAAKIAAKKLAKEGAEEAAQELGKEAAKKVGKEAVKKVSKKSAKDVAKAGVKQTAEGAAKEAAGQGTKEISEAAASEVTKNTGKSIGCIVGCVMGAATAAAYWAKKPNKEEKEACDALQTEMLGAQATLSDTQSEMATMSEEIINLSDEANTYNEDANDELKDQKSEYDLYMSTYTILKEKVDAGEPLKDSEKELYNSVSGYLSELGVTMEDTVEETSDEVNDLYDEIGTYQDGYDVAAESMGEIEGLTDYAESFDTTTRTMCYVEGAAQGLNAASSAKSAYQAFALASSGSWAFGATAWAYAFGVMGAAAAATSGIATKQQFDWAGQVGTEIEMRKATQDINVETMDIYTEEIDAYDGYMQGVEDLELDVPTDMAPPEVKELPENEPEPTGKDAVPDILKPKKEESKDKES